MSGVTQRIDKSVSARAHETNGKLGTEVHRDSSLPRSIVFRLIDFLLLIANSTRSGTSDRRSRGDGERRISPRCNHAVPRRVTSVKGESAAVSYTRDWLSRRPSGKKSDSHRYLRPTSQLASPLACSFGSPPPLEELDIPRLHFHNRSREPECAGCHYRHHNRGP